MSLYAIAGSQGTGKSTLLAALNVLQITRKTSRSILSEWGVSLSQVNNDRTLTVKFQDEILARKIVDERWATETDQIVFTERTYADLFVYAVVALGKDNEYSEWLDEYYLRCVEAQRTYSGVFYLTGGHFQPVYDGVRAVNKHYSRMVDLTMYEYTCNMSPSVTPIHVADLDERVHIVMEALHNRPQSE
jgi:predicted ATPase